jgi:hypothetical protein
LWSFCIYPPSVALQRSPPTTPPPPRVLILFLPLSRAASRRAVPPPPSSPSSPLRACVAAAPPLFPAAPSRRPSPPPHLLPVHVLFLLGFVRRRRRTGRQLMLPRRHEGKWGFRQQSPPYACPPSALPLLEMQGGAFARTVVGRERPRASGGHAWLRPRSKASVAQRQ